jgi:DNA-binding NtrC family response regulator
MSVPSTCGIVPGVPSVSALGQRLRGLFHREPRVVLQRQILIVDSDARERQSTTRLVESLGYEALPTQNLAEALARFDDQDPEFVLLGLDLDDASGLDALDQIRALDGSLSVIMLAPSLYDSRAAEAMRKGAVAYLAKPFGPDDLRELFGRRK